MSSSQQTPVVQQQTKDPWAVSQPFLQQGYTTAQQYLQNNTGYQPYTGQTIAALDPNLTNSLTSIANTANANLGGSPLNQAAMGLANTVIGNQGLTNNQQQLASNLSGNANPYLQDVINQQMNQVNSAMSGAGRYGSGAHSAAVAGAIAPTLAQDYMQRQQMLQQIYGQGAQQAGQFAQLAPSLDAQQYMPAQMLGGVGQFYQDRAQSQLNDQIKLYNAQQAYPWEQLARFNAIVAGSGGLGGTTITSSQVNQPSTLQKAFGGALVGAGLGSAIPGIGTGIGAAAGGLGGLLL